MRIIVCLLMMLLLSLTACSGEVAITETIQVTQTATQTETITVTETQIITTTVPRITSSIILTDEERTAADIYSAVIRQFYTIGNTPGEPPNFPVIYLVEGIDVWPGDPTPPDLISTVLEEPVQLAISANLSDLPADFIWVNSFSDVSRDPYTGAVEGYGAIIRLGNIDFWEDGTALVPGSIYFGLLGAGGRSYILEKVNGNWQVVGDKGWDWQA